MLCEWILFLQMGWFWLKTFQLKLFNISDICINCTELCRVLTHASILVLMFPTSNSSLKGKIFFLSTVLFCNGGGCQGWNAIDYVYVHFFRCFEIKDDDIQLQLFCWLWLWLSLEARGQDLSFRPQDKLGHTKEFFPSPGSFQPLSDLPTSAHFSSLPVWKIGLPTMTNSTLWPYRLWVYESMTINHLLLT